MIGDRLKELRSDAGMNQVECAAIVGTTKQYVSQLEGGRNKTPNGAFLEGWARHFRVHHRWLTTGVGPKYLSENAAPEAAADTEIDSLRRQIDSLSVVLASLVSITARHRPLEAEEIARLIRGNQSLDLVQHDLVADMLDLIEPSQAGSATPTARARKRSAS